MPAAADAVTLDESVGEQARKKSRGASLGRLVSLKIVVALFALFVLVVSDVFTNNVVSCFGGAVVCRAPTPFGTAVQGLFLVIFYILALYLVESGVI